MKIILNIPNLITKFLTWLGTIGLGFMMLYIFISVVMRKLESPLAGNVEIVQLLMVFVISCSLPYCESQDSHISIDLLFKKFAEGVQKIMQLIINVLSLVILITVAVVYYRVAFNSAINGGKTTEVLSISFFPFETLIA